MANLIPLKIVAYNDKKLAELPVPCATFIYTFRVEILVPPPSKVLINYDFEQIHTYLHVYKHGTAIILYAFQELHGTPRADSSFPQHENRYVLVNCERNA